MCALAVSRLLAMLYPRYGRLRTHHTLRVLYLCFLLFVLIVGVARLPMLNPVNREAVPLVHTLYVFMCCVFFSSHTPLSFEKESSETILLFSDSGGSELREVCKQLPRSRYSWNRCVLGTTEVTVLTELVWVTFFLGSSFLEEAAAGRQAFSSPFMCVSLQ